MSKVKKYDLRQLRQYKADQGVDVIEFDAPDGKAFRVPAPGFFPDEAYEALKASDNLALARALLGTDYDDYKASGGRADDLGLILEAWSKDQGIELPKS